MTREMKESPCVKINIRQVSSTIIFRYICQQKLVFFSGTILKLCIHWLHKFMWHSGWDSRREAYLNGALGKKKHLTFYYWRTLTTPVIVCGSWTLTLMSFGRLTFSDGSIFPMTQLLLPDKLSDTKLKRRVGCFCTDKMLHQGNITSKFVTQVIADNISLVVRQNGEAVSDRETYLPRRSTSWWRAGRCPWSTCPSPPRKGSRMIWTVRNEWSWCPCRRRMEMVNNQIGWLSSSRENTNGFFKINSLSKMSQDKRFTLNREVF